MYMYMCACVCVNCIHTCTPMYSPCAVMSFASAYSKGLGESREPSLPSLYLNFWFPSSLQAGITPVGDGYVLGNSEDEVVPYRRSLPLSREASPPFQGFTHLHPRKELVEGDSISLCGVSGERGWVGKERVQADEEEAERGKPKFERRKRESPLLESTSLEGSTGEIESTAALQRCHCMPCTNSGITSGREADVVSLDGGLTLEVPPLSSTHPSTHPLSSQQSWDGAGMSTSPHEDTDGRVGEGVTRGGGGEGGGVAVEGRASTQSQTTEVMACKVC